MHIHYSLLLASLLMQSLGCDLLKLAAEDKTSQNTAQLMALCCMLDL